MPEAFLDGFVARIHVEIGVAGEAAVGCGEAGLGAAKRGDGTPSMAASAVQGMNLPKDRTRFDLDGPAQPSGHRHRPFIDLDDQPPIAPAHAARADGDVAGGTVQIMPTPFRHRPFLASGPIKDGVDADMMLRIAPAAAPGQGVPGREDAADESDDGERMASVVAQRIDIPPGIAAFGNLAVEMQSCRIVRAA